MLVLKPKPGMNLSLDNKQIPNPHSWKSIPFSVGFHFMFLTEETLLSLRAPNKEALPNSTDQQLPALILTPQTCQLNNQF